jgi:hypothetical protein
MVQQKESSLFPDDTGLINPLVSQLSVEPNVDMDTGVDNDETADAQYSPALTKSSYTTTMVQSTLSPVSGERQPGY